MAGVKGDRARSPKASRQSGSPPPRKPQRAPDFIEIIRPQDYDEAERIILDTLTRAAERNKREKY